jgi:hypothetical protein
MATSNNNVPADLDLAALDDELGRLQRVLCLAIECGFEDVVEDVRRHILREHLPACMTMLCAVNEEARDAVAARYRRLQALAAPQLK